MNSTTFQILAVLRGGRRDAAEVLLALRDVLGEDQAPALASFYRSIKRALDDGFIHISGSVATTDGPGRRSQVYEITGRGTEAVEAEAVRLRALAEMALGDGVVR